MSSLPPSSLEHNTLATQLNGSKPHGKQLGHYVPSIGSCGQQTVGVVLRLRQVENTKSFPVGLRKIKKTIRNWSISEDGQILRL